MALLAFVVRVFHHPAVELHRVQYFRAGKFPGVAVAQPVFRMFHLMAVFDALLEHPVFIADPVTVARQAQGGHGIQEAGGQPAQAAVAQRRIRFQGANRFQIQVQLAHGLGEFVHEFHIYHAISQGAADQEFQGQVVDALGMRAIIGALGFHPAFHEAVAHHIGRYVIPIALGGGIDILAGGILQAVGQGQLDGLCVQAEIVVL